jgi:CCR4-NOT transcription complex subunit 6
MKVISFNLLAQTKIKRALFPQAATITLKWAHRSVLLYDLLSGFDADILCLQEVDLFDEHHSSRLTNLGYEGRYASKREKAGGDGLYTGWQTDRYALLQYRVLDLSPIMSSLIASGANANIAQICLLRNLIAQRDFLLINTHLYWAPGFDELRREQMSFIVDYCFQSYPEGTAPAVVLCGDLNSDPESQCCRLLRERGFASCCSSCPFSVYSTDFVAVLDYIWVWPGSVVSFEECPVVDPGQVISAAEGGIPNIRFPSDHIPVCARVHLH